jgi:hypothetical protein
MMLGGPSRDWTDARLKVEREGKCRNCSQLLEDVPIEADHTIGRRYDEPKKCAACNGGGVRADGRADCGICSGAGHLKQLYVDPDGICPLCADCHRAKHRGKLELLPLLTPAEQAYAVLKLGGIMAAFSKLTIDGSLA